MSDEPVLPDGGEYVEPVEDAVFLTRDDLRTLEDEGEVTAELAHQDDHGDLAREDAKVVLTAGSSEGVTERREMASTVGLSVGLPALIIAAAFTRVGHYTTAAILWAIAGLSLAGWLWGISGTSNRGDEA